MPDLLEHMYCSQQINIPPNLPFILKQYAKAAIRTQPYDLLYWSAAYFRAKANNSPPPVKERLEYPPVDTPSRLSPGFLKVLHKQLGENEYVSEEILLEKWLGVCLVQDALESMLRVGSIQDKVPWLKFVAIAAGHLCANLSKTMVMVCEVLTEEPDGGSAMIPVETFEDLYQYLARLDCGPTKPHSLHTIDHGSTPSITHTSKTTPPSTAKGEGKAILPSDKDSRAGLMVWDDVKPEVTEDRVSSPKHTEELGASSELGLEVYDEATGPVTEVITLFPAKPQTESEISITHPDPSKFQAQQSSMDKITLSHSSLEENKDWIKITPQTLNEKLELYAEKAEILPDKGTTEDGGSETNAEEAEDLEKQGDSKNAEIEPSEGEVIEEGAEDESNDNNLEEKTIEESEKEASTHEEESEPGKPNTEDEGKAEASEMSMTKPNDEGEKSPTDQEINEPLASLESILEPREIVTVQHFVKDDLVGSTVQYSTEEIRKGYYSDKSGSRIERASSENTIKAAETVHVLNTDIESSANFIAQEKSDEEKVKGSESQSDTASFTVLPPEDNWKEVPGIGPVIPEPQIIAVVEYMHYWAAKQQGMVMPRNINHILCPPLDLPRPDEFGKESKESLY
uniref:RIIa domain-containing protein n=1 Tax=Homalodisca liturata TaxID=320908 RepID=A0A1B6HGB3_9HEMI